MSKRLIASDDVMWSDILIMSMVPDKDDSVAIKKGTKVNQTARYLDGWLDVTFPDKDVFSILNSETVVESLIVPGEFFESDTC